MREEKISFKEFLYETFLLIVGCLLIALSFVLFFDPHSIAPGGLTGLAVIINYLFNIPLWFVNLIFNVPLFILAYKVLTKRECLKTLLGIVFFTLALNLFENFANFQITNDVLLSTLTGGVILGLGLGVIFNINGTTGGTDLIGLILNRWLPSISVPKLMGVADFIVVMSSIFATGKIEIGLYSALGLYIAVVVSDMVIQGFYSAKSFTIISNSPDEISNAILEKMNRGVTILSAKGGYTKEEKDALLVVVGKREVSTLRKIVKSVDPNAFVVITDVHEALGEGFKQMY
ncbi:MAG: YitT family protein [Terrisporobacter othiniensis]|uniref:YitT family protein n=1 Tax=Terrisporobacter hibernicus TaxID=2813371 RepID=A0AAX2ZK93_9FIRM|nr:MULTISPECIES: YitT family protein [Terrisporobacter]MBN9648727.1 YitT family protein [Terrisporobacter glycolicus]MDU4860549.1 YitT family protein [Terrisporobacter othiniensis]MDU6994408.1 YitT family protein [Terrisporobacter othiniensis]UEL48935.1 YitT family protein [Terrisporobacter hibernicus]